MTAPLSRPTADEPQRHANGASTTNGSAFARAVAGTAAMPKTYGGQAANRPTLFNHECTRIDTNKEKPLMLIRRSGAQLFGNSGLADGSARTDAKLSMGGNYEKLLVSIRFHSWLILHSRAFGVQPACSIREPKRLRLTGSVSRQRHRSRRQDRARKLFRERLNR
jgi:hypothetical protein